MRVFFAEVTGEAPAGWMARMGPEKRARIERMRKKSDAQAAVTAHRLLCYALKKTFGILPKEGDWQKETNGKPYLKDARNVHFNISHSGLMAMCAVDDKPVGADIESIGPFPGDVARRIMSAEERSAFLLSNEKERLFFKIWTLKEAYLKYTGVGISGLDGITVYPSGNEIKTNVDCAFALIDGISGYQAAVCAENVDFTVEHVQRGALDIGVPEKPRLLGWYIGVPEKP